LKNERTRNSDLVREIRLQHGSSVFANILQDAPMGGKKPYDFTTTWVDEDTSPSRHLGWEMKLIKADRFAFNQVSPHQRDALRHLNENCGRVQNSVIGVYVPAMGNRVVVITYRSWRRLFYHESVKSVKFIELDDCVYCDKISNGKLQSRIRLPCIFRRKTPLANGKVKTVWDARYYVRTANFEI